MSGIFLGGVLSMAAVLTVSNYLVQFPVGDWMTWAAFTYPLAFLVTDCVNRAADAATARRVVVVGFVFGVPLSFFFNYYFPAGDVAAADIVIVAARIAFASGAAFAAAQLLDVTIFDRFRRAAWWLPPLASSMPSSLLDTALFFFLAFAYTDVPWLSLAIGDFAVKAAMALLLLPSYRFIVWRLAVS